MLQLSGSLFLRIVLYVIHLLGKEGTWHNAQSVYFIWLMR